MTSPNYNGSFEFNKEKLTGGLTAINVDCTYKPYTPYIKLNPNLEGSYYSNTDYNDSIGLICGGDFSLGIINDAWNVFPNICFVQNKDYRNILGFQLLHPFLFYL